MKRTPNKSWFAGRLLRLMLQLVLVPMVALVVPLVFGIAWLHEALADLARSALPHGPLLPLPVRVRVRVRDDRHPRP